LLALPPTNHNVPTSQYVLDNGVWQGVPLIGGSAWHLAFRMVGALAQPPHRHVAGSVASATVVSHAERKRAEEAERESGATTVVAELYGVIAFAHSL
jgi:hypothetical protein